jgi:hypothetical protein
MYSQPSGFASGVSARSRLLAGLLAAVGLLVFAGPASASSLSVNVSPSIVKLGNRYTLTIRGSSDGPQQAVQVWSQKASTQCAPTSSQEFARRNATKRLRQYVPPGPFLFVKHVRANRLGARRICAYLDNGPNSPPQLTAGTTYKILPPCTRFRRRHCVR